MILDAHLIEILSTLGHKADVYSGCGPWVIIGHTGVEQLFKSVFGHVYNQIQLLSRILMTTTNRCYQHRLFVLSFFEEECWRLVNLILQKLCVRLYLECIKPNPHGIPKVLPSSPTLELWAQISARTIGDLDTSSPVTQLSSRS